jgi:hypothetical protein
MSSGGDSDVIVAKCTTLLNHVMNIHIHDITLFPECSRAPLTGKEARKKWLKPSDYKIDFLRNLLSIMVERGQSAIKA